MKRILCLCMVLGLCFGLTGCSSEGNKGGEPSKETTVKNDEKKKTIDDFGKAKEISANIVNDLNDKIDNDFSFKEIKYDKSWIHVIYSNNTPITFEIDLTIREEFKGVTIDNNSTEKVNEGYRSLPMVTAKLQIFDLGDKDIDGIINLLSDMTADNYKGSSVDVMDNKTLNLFSISVK